MRHRIRSSIYSLQVGWSRECTERFYKEKQYGQIKDLAISFLFFILSLEISEPQNLTLLHLIIKKNKITGLLDHEARGQKQKETDRAEVCQ